MKHRNNFKYTLPLALLLCLLGGMGSCVKEEFVDGGEDTNNYSSVAIRVKLPEQSIVNPMSRAEVTDFDILNNLNIFISDKGTIKKRIYLDFVTDTWGDGTAFKEGTANVDGVTVTFEDNAESGYREYRLTFSDTYLADIPLKSCRFHAVANWGSAITTDDDNNSVTNLRDLEVKTEETDLDSGVHGIVPTPNVMYGEIVSERTEVRDPAKPGEVTRVVTVGLKRTVAMITLAIDGSGLNNDVVIQLDDVTLHNVPSVCRLGSGNKPTKHEGQIAKLGDFKGGNMIANGYKLVGKGRFDTGFNESQGYKTTIGGHYTKDDNAGQNELVRPMFLFENMQGSGAASDDQKQKRPVGIGATESAIAAYNENGVCSYIVVSGTYVQYGTEGNVAQKGTAKWRFFLGNNVTDNFDVERNTNYRLTLKLSGTGIGEANSSWRVDADLETPIVVGEADMVVGGGGEMFCVEFIDPNYANQNMKMTTNGGDFVYAYVANDGSGKSYNWLPITKAGSKAYKHYLTADKQLWFYVSPLLPDDNVTTANERTCTVDFTKTDGTILATVSFTQYRPVTFSITVDDLTRYASDEDLLKAKTLIETYYKHDFANDGDFVFYADRVDRVPMPWGFTGVTLDKNQNTGFENVYHLIKPLPENTGDKCQTHVDYAAHYLPTGKGFRETGSNYIDYSNGSCMMHAAMENHFQQYAPKPANTLSPDDLLGVKIANIYRPGSEGDPTPDNRLYSWCVPSIVGCQLVERLDRFYKRHGITARGFDPKYPISKWTSYWTSNSATADLAGIYPGLSIDGRNRSFVYQFDMGLDMVEKGDVYPARLLMPRATSIKYRLLNIRPTQISKSGGAAN